MRYGRVLRESEERVTIDRTSRSTISQDNPTHDTVEADIGIIVNERRESVQVGDVFVTKNIYYGTLNPRNDKIRVGDFVLRGSEQDRLLRKEELTVIDTQDRANPAITRLVMENKNKGGSGTRG